MEVKEYITHSTLETQEIAQKLAVTLKDGSILTLHGDLGSGKTTFMQGLAKGLGITKRIISPTFVVVRSYIEDGKKLYHIDLYRLESNQELIDLGIQEILNDSAAVVAIEWADKLGQLLPKNRIDVFFEYLTESDRKITLKVMK